MIYYLAIGFLIIILSGCSFLGADLAQTRTYAITKPPFQIVVSGDLTEKDKTAVRQIIGDLSRTKYQDYKFNDKIQVTVIGSESDIESINVENHLGGQNEKE